MDAFYASVEENDNPRLRGRPVIVGGLNNRGIVTTANYEARKYGIHSAMPIYVARRKCPMGCFIPTRIERYKEVSGEIFKILYSFTDLIEPLSIDEAYVDISDIKKEPLKVAMEIKKKIVETTGLTVSIGISYNKFLAKLASDWNKPNGIKIITENMIPNILMPLPVKSVHGIGPKSSEKLNNIGIYTIRDLLMLSEEFLVDFFGKSGIDVYNRIRGIDNRKINTKRKRKSLGTEHTFRNDTKDKDLLKKYLHRFARDLASSLEKRQLYCKTVTLKIKNENFKLRTKSKTLNNYINFTDEIFKVGVHLLDEMDVSDNIRLIGLTVSNFTVTAAEQLSLFD